MLSDSLKMKLKLKLQPKTLNKIYFNFFRFVGLSCAHSSSKIIEKLLIAYNAFIITQDLIFVYYFTCDIQKTFQELKIIENLIVYFEIALILAYRIVRMFIGIRVIVVRKFELKIAEMFQEIVDDFQLKLYHPYEMGSCYDSKFYKYFWFFDLSINFCGLFFLWNYNSFPSFLANFRYIFTLMGFRAVFFQFFLFIIKIDETLENLVKCLKNNLNQQTIGHPADMSVANNQCMSVCSWPYSQVKQYLLQRIWTMKCIYGKITEISLTCSSLFGLSVLLTIFLCTCELTEIMYVVVTYALDDIPPHTMIWFGLYTMLPTVFLMLQMCWLSEKCSKRVSKITESTLYFLCVLLFVRNDYERNLSLISNYNKTRKPSLDSIE